MIVVEIVLRSAISRDRDRALGIVRIANVGGTVQAGEYQVIAVRPHGRPRVGRVVGFPRKSKSALELLRRALNALHEKGDLP